MVIKPGGSTRDPVNPGDGPIRVCQKTGWCNDPAKPGRPGRSTHDSGETRCVFFSKMRFETHQYIYSMFSRKKLCFFNVG
jgi:hypothetical protein